jgi:hypothetical protein
VIKSITVTNYVGESITLDLGNPEKSGFSILGIEGLGPSKADINTKDIAGMDGSQYLSARANARNIVLTLGFLFNPTIEAMRQQSYKYFPLKKRVHLVVETDNRSCEIYGYVESNTPNIFSPQESTQISIICPDPYFYSLDKGVAVYYAIDPVFEFPFSNESTTGNFIEFSNIYHNREQTIYYLGDAEVGFTIIINAFGPADNITIYNTMTGESMLIDTARLAALTGAGITAGDEIRLSTAKGNKFLTLLRMGTYTNILNCLDKNSDWLQIVRGDNIFAYTAVSGDTNLGFRIEYQLVYEGV